MKEDGENEVLTGLTEPNDKLIMAEMFKNISIASRKHEALISKTSIGLAAVAIGVLALMRFNKGAEGVDFLLAVVLAALGFAAGYNVYGYPTVTPLVPAVLLREDSSMETVFFIACLMWLSRLVPRFVRALLPLTIAAIGVLLAIVHYPDFRDLLTHSSSFQEVVRQLK